MPTLLRIRRIARPSQLTVEELDSLLNRGWHRRAWTFQEIILASNPVIVCGTKCISWAALYGGVLAFDDTAYKGKPLYDAYFRRWVEIRTARRTKRSSSSIVEWKQLFEIWVNARRPTRWNGNDLRILPADSRRSNDDWSVRAYHKNVLPARYLESWKYMVITHLLQVVLVICSACGPFALYCTYGKCFGYGSIQGLLPIAIGLIYGWFFSVVVLCFLIPDCKNNLELIQDENEHDVHYETGKLISLVGILQALRERRATNAKDKSFAMHGVMQNLDLVLSKPDYGKSLGLVYQELFTDLVNWHPALINLLIDIGPALPKTPSWVPDWSTSQKRMWLPRVYLYDIVDMQSEGASRPKVRFANDRIIIEGVKLKAVNFRSEPFERLSESIVSEDSANSISKAVLSKTLRTLAVWIRLARVDVPVIDAYQSVCDALYRVLRLTNRTSKEAVLFSECFHHLATIPNVSDPTDSTNPSAAEGEVLVALSKLKQKPRAFKVLVKLVNKLVDSRSVFIAGGLVGSGPLHMAEGDEVLVIKGVSIPMIARREPNTEPVVYTFIGPAYVVGYMDLIKFDPRSIDSSWEEFTFH